VTWKTYFKYLDELRAGGEVNMFAAPGRLAAFYGLTPAEAMEVTYAWMKTFNDTDTLDERVAAAEAARPPTKTASSA
jgi:hypothetical protein